MKKGITKVEVRLAPTFSFDQIYSSESKNCRSKWFFSDI